VDRNYGLDRGQPSPDHLAELLTMYYENRGQLKDDGKWCKQRIEEFTWPDITQQMLDQVETILAMEPEEPEFKGFGTPAKID
jgi:hypothetical protein